MNYNFLYAKKIFRNSKVLERNKKKYYYYKMSLIKTTTTLIIYCLFITTLAYEKIN